MSSRRELVRSIRDSVARDPQGWRGLARQVLRRGFLRRVRYALAPPDHQGWRQETQDGRVRVRQYRSYEEYVRHQASKLALLDLRDWDAQFHGALLDRLRQDEVAWRARGVLCLGARQGSEVRAFRDVGAFALGIDLNPGPGNRYVLPGDFHALDFTDDSVDVVYTNSIDHALDLDRLLGEVRRVLHRDGLLVVEAMSGRDEGVGDFDFWATLEWSSVDDLVALIERRGFAVTGRRPFELPWPGEMLRFAVRHPGEVEEHGA